MHSNINIGVMATTLFKSIVTTLLFFQCAVIDAAAAAAASAAVVDAAAARSVTDFAACHAAWPGAKINTTASSPTRTLSQGRERRGWRSCIGKKGGGGGWGCKGS